MLIRAAEEMGLDLDASWMVGDMISDVLAGINAGCRGSILVRTGKGLSESEGATGLDYLVADDIAAAAGLILSGHDYAGNGGGGGTAGVRMGSSDILRDPSR
jgi:D-glycero-D-manno-heptose 1,7-bisphosphate phosphatase